MHVEDTNAEIPDTSPPSTDELVEAINKGVAAESPEAKPEPDQAVEADAAEPSPEAAKPDEEAKPDDTKAETAKPDPVEEEIASLNLKEKSAERFRELASDREAMAPLRSAMKELGLDDPKRAAEALSRVRDADFVISRVVESGASHVQFDQTLEYLSLVNQGMTGDLAALEKAWALIEPEIQAVAKALGKEVPGIVDPLADHADLREEVEVGDLSRPRALEIARDRQRNAMVDARRTTERESGQQQRAHEQAVITARTELNELGAELQAADPERYGALAPALVAKVREITAQHPPHEWVARAARVYATLPLPRAAEQARPAVGHVPVRATGARPGLAPATFDDPLDAIRYGIEQASR